MIVDRGQYVSAKSAHALGDHCSSGPVEDVHSVKDITIPGPESELPARLYKPLPKDGQHLSALVFFHGRPTFLLNVLCVPHLFTGSSSPASVHAG